MFLVVRYDFLEVLSQFCVLYADATNLAGGSGERESTVKRTDMHVDQFAVGAWTGRHDMLRSATKAISCLLKDPSNLFLLRMNVEPLICVH